MRRARITYLIGSLARGGAEGQLLQLLRKLDQSRWEASLVTFDDLNAERAADVVSCVSSVGIPSNGNSRSLIRG
ncbi:MAG: hypothetical protein DMG49_00195, partial [Acidobacteria bacterium]